MFNRGFGMLFWFVVVMPQVQAEEPLKVLLYQPGNPPYTMLDGGSNKGIFTDMFNRITDITKVRFELIGRPVARGLAEFDAGRVDVEPGVNPNWRAHMRVPGLYSMSYAKSVEVVVFAPGKKKPVKVPSDLFGEIVGVVRGFVYPKFDAAMSAGLITRLDNLSSDLLLEQLLVGRLDQIFIGYDTILYMQKIRPEYRVLEIGNVVDEQDVMLRLHPDKAAYLPLFNQALQQMMKDGEIEKIYSQYRFVPEGGLNQPN
jgi:polar amino acid transport system substrate-binding protein